MAERIRICESSSRPSAGLRFVKIQSDCKPHKTRALNSFQASAWPWSPECDFWVLTLSCLNTFWPFCVRSTPRFTNLTMWTGRLRLHVRRLCSDKSDNASNFNTRYISTHSFLAWQSNRSNFRIRLKQTTWSTPLHWYMFHMRGESHYVLTLEHCGWPCTCRYLCILQVRSTYELWRKQESMNMQTH